MGKSINFDYIYKHNGIVKVYNFETTTGFCFGDAERDKTLVGIQTCDIEVARAVMYAGQKMVAFLEGLEKTKSSKKVSKSSKKVSKSSKKVSKSSKKVSKKRKA